MRMQGDLTGIVSTVVMAAIFLIAIYVVFRLVFLKEPPKSKPSLERHGPE